MGDHEEREFEDGEHKARSLVNVRGRNVFVIASLYGDAHQSVNDKLCRLLFFIGSLRDASAARVNAVIPYLCYARKDRRTQFQDPISSRYVAQMLEAVGTDRVIALEVHNSAAFQNAHRCLTEHVQADQLFVDHFAALLPNRPMAVVSPDPGGVKRAERLREALEARTGQTVASGFVDKKRRHDRISGGTLVGDVEGLPVIVLDDLIASGATMVTAAESCRRGGASRVYAAATHGVFAAASDQTLERPCLDGIVVSDSVPPFRLSRPGVLERLHVLGTAPLFAHAIRQIHENS